MTFRKLSKKVIRNSKRNIRWNKWRTGGRIVSLFSRESILRLFLYKIKQTIYPKNKKIDICRIMNYNVSRI